MITIDSIELRYGRKELFKGIHGLIGAKDRIGLVGSNGMGKSTLLKVLQGLQELDGGKIDFASYVTLGYLPQDGIVVTGKTVYKEVESAFDEILGTQAQLEEASAELDAMDPVDPEYMDLLEVIGTLEHRLADMEATRLRSKIEKVLMGLGFSLEDMGRDCGEFSGGWQMRIALAKLLLREPSLLLLDEPTNHLDMQSQRWLESYLAQYAGAMILISHDRAFLDMLTTRTFELTMGRMYVYAGNYSFFEKEKEVRQELTAKSYASQQKMIEQQERFINRFRAKSSKAKQVQSRIKALEKIERIELEEEETRMHFKFPEAKSSGQVVLELKGVKKCYDELEVFRGIDLKLEKGERLGIMGVNGAGKSTLAKVITGREGCTEGERVVGHNVELAYFAQDLANTLNGERTVLETIEAEAVPEERKNCRSILGAFLFRSDDVFKKVKVLSGGERCRLALSCLLVKKANCIVLDEPTNHLDMKSKAVLQEAIRAFKGTLVIISHDRDFVDPLVSRVVEMNNKGMRSFAGNVSYYLEKVEGEWALEKAPVKAEANKMGSKERRKREAQKRERLKPLKKRLAEIEGEVAAVEKEKSEWEVKLADPEFFKQGDEAKAGMQAYDVVQKRLEDLTEEWVALEEELASLEE